MHRFIHPLVTEPTSNAFHKYLASEIASPLDLARWEDGRILFIGGRGNNTDWAGEIERSRESKCDLPRLLVSRPLSGRALYRTAWPWIGRADVRKKVTRAV